MVKSLHLEYVTPPQITAVWPSLLGDLMRAPDTWQNFTDEHSIYEELLADRYQLWTLLNSTRLVKFVFITQVIEYAKGNSLQLIWAYGADPKTVVMSIDALEQAAIAKGCVRLEVIVHRDGWGRLLEKHGYAPFYQVLSRDLTMPDMGDRH